MAEELTYTLAFTGQETDTNLGKVPVIEADLAEHTADTDIHTTAAEKAAWDAKQDALPTAENDKYLHTNKTTGELEWSTAGAGVTETTLANYLAHKEEYDASDNFIAITDADPLESAKVAYNNAESGLEATNVQDAIDELAEGGGGGGTAADITYNNTSSGLSAENVQDAIDELASEKQDAATAITTSNIGSQSVSHATSADTATSATTATSAGSATKATQDGNGNNIVNTYQTKNGAITTSNIGTQSVAHATSADTATSATSATKATQDGSGNNIVSTYQTKSGAITTSNIGSQSVNYATSAGTAASVDGFSIASMTQAQYDALATKDPNTLYLIVG